MRELVFEVSEEEEGGYSARSVGEHIYTQGDSWEELEAMVLEATRRYFEEVSNPPGSIRLQLQKVLQVA